MTKPANIPGIEKATNKPWEEWVEIIDAFGGRELPHKQIAEKVYAMGIDGWWTQSITVAYEQHIGRREPGQKNDGTYELSVTKTLDGSRDDAMRAWEEHIKDLKKFNGIEPSDPPKVSTTDRWHHWTCSLADETRVTVDAWEKAPGKAGVALTHTKLPSKEAKEMWHTYWKGLIDRLDNH